MKILSIFIYNQIFFITKSCVSGLSRFKNIYEMDAMRASGLIPVNPRIVINKYTQLLMYIAEGAINY